VLVLEKCWAKIFGSYQRIEAGTAGEAFYPLTGSPHKRFFHEDFRRKDYIWNKIKKADSLGQPMATAVYSAADEDVSKSEVKKLGLVDAHAYSLIAAREIEDDSGKKVRLIQIRNPWGKKEWQGDWGDKSDKWTEKTKDQVDFKRKNDGTFWISFEDYVDFFYLTTICYYNKKYEDTFVADQHDQGGIGMVKLTNPKDHDKPISFTVDQLNSRFVDEAVGKDYSYPTLSLILTKLEDGGAKQVFIEADRESDTHVSFFMNKLAKGEYVLMYSLDF
jgi:calpain-15